MTRTPKRVAPWFLSLTVENVRCFGAAQTLDLSDRNGRPAHWTIVLGDNGTGKSCLLQCLAAVAPQHWHAFNHSYTVHDYPRSPAAGSLRSSSASMIIEATVALGQSLTAQPITSSRGSMTWEHGAEPIADTYVLGRREETPRHDEIEPAGMLLIAYGAYRRWGRTRLASPEQPPDATLFDTEAVLPSPEEWFLQRDYVAENPRNSSAVRKKARALRDLVGETLLKVLPGVSALTTRVLDATSGRTELVARVADGEIPVAELGLGYQSTLAWIVDLAARLAVNYPDSDDPLREPAVVLIDEVDIHLHPRWQRTLLAEVGARFPNVQFVVTAHSPLIVQAAPDANVVVLHRAPDGVRIENDPISVRHWRVDQILTSDLFGLEGARDPRTDALIARRDKLLARTRRTAAEQREIARIDAELAQTPEGETPEQRDAMRIIMDAAAELRATANGGSARKRPRR